MVLMVMYLVSVRIIDMILILTKYITTKVKIFLKHYLNINDDKHSNSIEKLHLVKKRVYPKTLTKAKRMPLWREIIRWHYLYHL